MKIDPADPFATRTFDVPVFETMELAMNGPGFRSQAQKVEEALSGLRGVSSFEFDTTELVARVIYDARLTNPPAIHDAILAAGYLPSDLSDEVADTDTTPARRRAISGKSQK